MFFSNEYVARLKDEDRVMQILEKGKKLLEVEKTPSEMCRIYLQIIDHIYFKFDTRVIQQRHVSLTLNPALLSSRIFFKRLPGFDPITFTEGVVQ